jgi:methionyl-tRNA formyltransferase
MLRPYFIGSLTGSFYDTIAAGEHMTRIVFMGTPEFAVPVLDALADHYDVVAVYTRADKPAGRGKATVESPVKALACARGLVVEQPRTLRNEEVQARLRDYHPDLIVVAAYGLILPQAVLDIPPGHCLNTHASLLPRWRGASPITHAILAGDQETGITLIQMEAGVDTGPVIATRALPVAPEETTGTLTERLSQIGAELLIETLPAMLEGKIAPTPQPEIGMTYAGMVKKEDGLIDWNRPAVEIERATRAYNPWPSAYTFWNGALFKIWRAVVSDTGLPYLPGSVTQLDFGIGVSTGVGTLILREVQLAGKRAMPVEEFARGQRDFIGARLGGSEQ